MITYTCNCEACGREFTAARHHSQPVPRFCSKECHKLQPNHRPDPMTPDASVLNEAIRLYQESGGSIRAATRAIGVSHGVVTRWLNEAGIETRHTKSMPKGYQWPIEVLRKRAIGKQRVGKLSDDERTILAALNARELFPVPLYAVESHNIDFAWPDIKLAVEYNGGGWHNLPQVRANDDRKDALLKSLGWTVLWFPRLTKRDGFGGSHIALETLVSAVHDAVHSSTTGASTKAQFG